MTFRASQRIVFMIHNFLRFDLLHAYQVCTSLEKLNKRTHIFTLGLFG